MYRRSRLWTISARSRNDWVDGPEVTPGHVFNEVDVEARVRSSLVELTRLERWPTSKAARPFGSALPGPRQVPTVPILWRRAAIKVLGRDLADLVLRVEVALRLTVRVVGLARVVGIGD